MHPLGDPLQHVQRITRMGQLLGADLVSAFEHGRIDSQRWAEMVAACRACEQPQQCKIWLENAERDAGQGDGITTPFDGCCNAQALMALCQQP